MEVMKVSSRTDPAKLAGAIAEVTKKDGAVRVQAIGAGSVNQAMKGIIISRGYLVPTGVDTCIVPGFYNARMDDREVSGITMEVRAL